MQSATAERQARPHRTPSRGKFFTPSFGTSPAVPSHDEIVLSGGLRSAHLARHARE
jgi:hypothetical protein